MLQILVCEDDPAIRRLFVVLLEKKGFAVKPARNGIEALECLAEYRPDLIISDADMPKLGGIGLLERVSNDPLLSGTPFILASVNPIPGGMRRLGDAVLLSKPFTIESLDAAIKQALYGRTD